MVNWMTRQTLGTKNSSTYQINIFQMLYAKYANILCQEMIVDWSMDFSRDLLSDLDSLSFGSIF